MIELVPMVDGEPIVKEGKAVTVEVDAPTKDFEVKTFVDGVELTPSYILPDSVYNVLKWVGLLLLPTLAWVYSMLAGAWHLPYGEEIPFTLNVLGTMVAVLIGASSLSNIVRGA